MASARQLLEQADALMRRNRERGTADLPVLTEVVAHAAVIDDELVAETGIANPAPENSDVPLLTEVVDEAAMGNGVVSEPISQASSPDPAAVLEAMTGWPGPDTIDPSEFSVTGPSPDTLGLVPALPLGMGSRAVGSEPTPLPRGAFATPRHARPAAAGDVFDPLADPAMDFSPSPAGDEAPAQEPTIAAEEHADAAMDSSPSSAGNEVPALGSTITAKEPADFLVREPAREPESPAEAQTAGTASTPEALLPATAPTGAEPTASAIPPEPATTTLPAGSTHDDDAKWRALAEQISMQVLQRIDLFTDTGLKVQLAAHLEPVVRRASADLVASINDHVGQILRSYVAEAIEREIAQWRQDQR